MKKNSIDLEKEYQAKCVKAEKLFLLNIISYKIYRLALSNITNEKNQIYEEERKRAV